MNASEDTAVRARALLLDRLEGVLSTQSLDVPGFPFGSVVQYLIGEDGHPVLLISRLAQHTRNLAEDARCSLTIVQRDYDNVQEAARLTWLGRAEQITSPPSALQQRFQSYWPESADYMQMDFEFWRIQLHKARFIGGFGEIHWLPVAQLPLGNPFFGDAESSMVAHMNADHVNALRTYCAAAGVAGDAGEPVMTGVDAEGFHVRVNHSLVRFCFPSTARNAGDVRQMLIQMAEAGR